MELLASYGAELHDRRDLFLSVFRRKDERVAATKFMLENGVDVNACTKYGPPLHVAAKANKKELVQCLLDYGADRFAIFYGKTAAEEAEENGCTDIVKLLSGQALPIH